MITQERRNQATDERSERGGLGHDLALNNTRDPLTHFPVKLVFPVTYININSPSMWEW